MNKIYWVYFIIFSFSDHVSLYAQSSSQNYRMTKTIMDDSGDKSLDIIEYYDGLGRLVQTVQKKITPTGKDLIALLEYDFLSRESLNWLPTPYNGNGNWLDPETIKESSKSFYNDQMPYQMSIYGDSPLNRISEEYGPGRSWYDNSKSVKVNHKTNVFTEGLLQCSNYKAQGNTLIKQGSYSANDLYVTEYIDEENNLTYEFMNRMEQVVLVRRINEGVSHDTYYAYDNYGNLCFVLPPLLYSLYGSSWSESYETIKKYAYVYQYDERNRCIKKRLPGGDWIYYVYDKLDRLVFTQTGELRAKNKWLVTVMDDLDRPVLTGLCSNSFNGITITNENIKNKVIKASYVGNSAYYHGYTIKYDNITIASNQIEVLSVNYYDNYEYLNLSGYSALRYHNKTGYDNRYGLDSDMVAMKGLLTGAANRILDNTTTTKFIYKTYFYDYRGRLIQNQATNHMDGVNKVYFNYDFIGNVLEKYDEQKVRRSSQQSTEIVTTEYYKYYYDHAGRKTKIEHTLNNGPVVRLAENTYDELGRLKSITPFNKTSLNVSYIYNIRSWLNGMGGSGNGNEFYENLSYTYNGNISKKSWHMAAYFNPYYRKNFSYQYDNLSRLLIAQDLSDGGFTTLYTYDRNGNMKTLSRRSYTPQGTKEVDKLTFNYDGNKLISTSDAAENYISSTLYDFKDYFSGAGRQYKYNLNGSMTEDPYKGITISYNELELPMKILTPIVNGDIKYSYTADGNKLGVDYSYNPGLPFSPMEYLSVNNSTITNLQRRYVENKIYESMDGVFTNPMILTETGYIENGTYHFYVKDYQGNNKMVFDQNGAMVQSIAYYPYGAPFISSRGGEVQPYKYNDKEFDTMAKLNLYDYHARQYDPVICRFNFILSSKKETYSISPYTNKIDQKYSFVFSTTTFYNLDSNKAGYKFLIGSDEDKK